MAASRSALRFLKRSGLGTEMLSPRPRICPAEFIVNALPKEQATGPSVPVLQEFEGSPPPDRNVSRPWPDDNVSTQ